MGRRFDARQVKFEGLRHGYRCWHASLGCVSLHALICAQLIVLSLFDAVGYFLIVICCCKRVGRRWVLYLTYETCDRTHE